MPPSPRIALPSRLARLVALAAPALCLVVSACTRDPAGPPADPNAPLQLDATRYVAAVPTGGTDRRRAFQVIVRLVNRTGDTLFLANCFPSSTTPMFGVHMAEASSGQASAYAQVYGCTGHSNQLPVAPGTVRVDTLTVRGPNTYDGRTGQHFGVLEGLMRLSYGVQTCRGDGACRVARDATQSSPFLVVTD